ncbi:FtsJ-like methyltransferase-domain-containing protein [Jimgerdemannia flammicorona]|uniref:Cap-specific mRNA (nucleoside-2'-O-)-methyltransferase 1 n=1 Tax=Jimgerdemannia flammicorona TaxID=994334 RepID=A0A433QQ17_9FUNG|nr:FtsJ-like methyltransferase-domain-containing protein [Jimgerdemannia flammicorona]
MSNYNYNNYSQNRNGNYGGGSRGGRGGHGGHGGYGGGYNRSNQFREPREPPPLNDAEREALYRGHNVLFKKHYDFSLVKPVSNLTDLLFATPKWTLDRMQTMKRDLNNTRNRLNEKDIEMWHKHTRQTNFTGRVVATLRNKMDIEMCTNAWIKMAELHSHYEFIPDADTFRSHPDYADTFSSLHICEAPGAFIASTNHFLRQIHRDKIRWRWTGFSLNPYYEGNDVAAMVDDDRMILETLQNWYFGTDNSGNIFHHDNIRGIWKDRVGPSKVHLVTGDGSVDCSSDPNEQESLVSELHYAEAVCALGALRNGGSMVLKMFNLFECETICLLYMLGTYFDGLHVSKPSTSKSANAETYVIGTGFRGISDIALEQLMEFVSPTFPKDRAMFPLDSIPKEFLEEMFDCANFFTSCQKGAIERNLDLESMMNQNIRTNLRNLVDKVADEYIAQYKIEQIQKSLRMMQDAHLNGAIKDVGRSIAMERGGFHKRSSGNLEQRQNNKRSREKFLAANNEQEDTGPSATTERNGGSGAVEEHEFKRRTNMNAAPVVLGRIPDPPASKIEPGTSASTIGDNTADENGGFNEKGLKMMQSMGYKLGTGLGKDNQGIADAIKVEQRQGRLGLGHHLQDLGGDAMESVVFGKYKAGELPRVAGGPFFDDTDWTHCMPLLNEVNSQPLTHQDLENMGCDHGITIGDIFAGVITSQYASSEDIEKLYRAREGPMRVSLAYPNDDKRSFASLSATAFVGGILLELGMGFHFAITALQLASLDQALGIINKVSLDSHEPLRFVDLGCEDGGFAEYIAWQQRGYIQAVAFPRHEEGHAYETTDFRCQIISTTSSSYPKSAFLKYGEFPKDSKDLKTQVESIIGAESGNRSQGLVSFAVADVSVAASDVPKTRFVEFRTQRKFLAACHQALSILAPQGTFVCKVSDVLTRFTAGLLYILYRSFGKLTIIKPFTLLPNSPDRFVICQEFLGRSDAFLAHLDKVEQQLSQLPADLASQEAGFNIVEIVPITCIVHPAFAKYVAAATQRMIHREIAAIGMLEVLARAVDQDGRPSPEYEALEEKLVTAMVETKTRAAEMLLTSQRSALYGPPWRKHQSERSGRYYWYNAETKESRWV